MAKDIKSLMKSIRKITESESFASSKYSEVTEWISTGDYGLNRIISGSIYRGIPAGRVVLLGGESQCTPRNQRVNILYRHYFKDPIPKSLLSLNLSINDAKEVISKENVINCTVRLNEVCYSGNDIFRNSGISSRTFNRFLRIENFNTTQATLDKIYSFYLSRIFSIEIGDLEKMDTRDYLVSTPDGWQRAGKFFNKGALKCYQFTTENNKTLTASEKHLIQLDNGEWKPVNLLSIGDTILTIDGNSKITSINELPDLIDCVDIEILHENHRYYCEGISSHNSGKSFVAAQCAANALNELNYDMIFYFDSEGGAMKQFFESRGCDPNKIEQVLVSSVEDATVKILAAYTQIEEYKKENPELKCLFILDSLGALVTNKFVTDASSGKVVSDMGLRAKLCLDPNTPVLMSNGEFKPLSDVNIGDEVITHDNTPKKIVDKFDVKHQSYVKLKVNGETIKMSLDHKMLVHRDDKLLFMKAKDIKLTDKLVSL